MGRIELSGQILAVRLVLLRVGGDDNPRIPSGSFNGEVETIRDEDGNAFAKVFRRDSDARLFAIQKIAVASVSGSRAVLVVIYAPATSRTANAFASLVSEIGADVVKSWSVNIDTDGALLVASLDADVTPVGTAVKNNLWPAGWKKRQVGDPPEGPYTGARCIAQVLA